MTETWASMIFWRLINLYSNSNTCVLISLNISQHIGVNIFTPTTCFQGWLVGNSFSQRLAIIGMNKISFLSFQNIFHNPTWKKFLIQINLFTLWKMYLLISNYEFRFLMVYIYLDIYIQGHYIEDWYRSFDIAQINVIFWLGQCDDVNSEGKQYYSYIKKHSRIHFKTRCYFRRLEYEVALSLEQRVFLKMAFY